MFLTCPSVSQFISSGCFGGFFWSVQLIVNWRTDFKTLFRYLGYNVKMCTLSGIFFFHIFLRMLTLVTKNFDPSWKLIRRSFFKVEYWDQFWNVDDRVKEQRCWIKDPSSLKFDLHRGIFIKKPILNSTANYLLQKWHIHNLIWKLNFWFLYSKIKNVK